MTVAAALSRRLVLKAAAAAMGATALNRIAPAQTANPDLVLIALSDLHSPYLQLPKLLAEVRAIAANAGAPVRILINGDVFERGNVAALRSNGAADLAFLKALGAIAPTIVNLGNHETALVDDPALAVRAIMDCGATAIGNMVNPRTGQPYAQPSLRIPLGAGEIALVGVGTDAMPTYRQAVRPLVAMPPPVDYVASSLGRLAGGARLVVVMSHAGVAADKGIFRQLPPRGLLIGGHDHLRLDHADNERRTFFHTGSWGNHLRVVAVDARANDGPRLATTERAVGASGAAPDAALAAEIAKQEEAHLNAEDRAEVAVLPRALDLAESAIIAADAVRRAAGAHVGFLNHTSFGDGLPAGAINRYRFDSFLRFDGDVRVATVDGAVLREILRFANQHKAATIDERTGDFVYANELAIDPAERYVIAANGWTTMNQQAYLGRQGVAFQALPDIRVKAIVADALKAMR